MKKIYDKALTLLQMMALGNKSVQLSLFSRLDFLLGIKGAEQHLAMCLIEVNQIDLTYLCLCYNIPAIQ